MKQCAWHWCSVRKHVIVFDGGLVAVHPNMQGHTGATMSMGSSSVFSGSGKPKLVTQSSTENEMVGVYDT